ncbi:glycosyltransferase involved in cell wall biosynthesis [Nonlabens dokdonensis]|uniref:Glycosyl transferase, group 1 n=2 Tax=Nonlabens dokdonensis TaxID=328515 RepID=L7W600_NONDD|nr:glycosyltransferase family 4 protein [Nonlabens dokdonensis]AGC75216.1 glycosyl transferase, group 1 [Nonlabens dokdonensis DSW-6]PZX39043.1 glycosyltransferase involved in cell wall biosynthesis [Nonlabens dokdonensis]
MKNILYIGNKLASQGRTATTIDTLGPLLQKEGFNLRYASSIKNISRRMLHMMRMTYVNRNWAHVMLIDTYSTKNFWYAITISRICRSLKIKYIPILHGGDLPKRIIKNPKALNAYLKNAYQVVSPSDYLISAFAKAGYHNLTKINNFIELENYPYQRREIKTPKLLWVRSFAQIYNPEMAIKVFKLIKEKYPEATLTMVGPEKDGSLEKCKMLAEILQLQIDFTGLLSKSQWIELSKNHNIFINTTRFDNLPVSLIEAMALGLPVVSTDVGGISYLIENDKNGKLIPDNNVSEMVTAINDLIEQPSHYQQITNNARETATFYSWSLVRQQWNGLLQS